jgi:hypothetical protein
MVHGMDTDAISGCHVDRFARIMERAGLAIMGGYADFTLQRSWLKPILLRSIPLEFSSR